MINYVCACSKLMYYWRGSLIRGSMGWAGLKIVANTALKSLVEDLIDGVLGALEVVWSFLFDPFLDGVEVVQSF